MVRAGYKKTEVGDIPEDWDVTTAMQVCELVVDCKNRTPPVVDNSEFAVVRTPNVRDGKFVENQLRYTDEKSYREWTARAIPQIGDVLITREAPLGEVCLAPPNFKICLGQRMMLYRPDNNKSDSKFLMYSLMSSGVQDNLLRKIGGSTVGHARVDDIRELSIPFPPTLAEQKAISNALSDVDALIDSLEKLIAKKRDIKTGTMQQLLTGKKRLPGFGKGKGTKQSELGEIPEDWDVVPLGTICSSIVDGTHYTPKYAANGIPFYSVENVSANEFSDTKHITESEHQLLIKRCKPEKGDLLLTRIGTLGKTKFIDWDVEASIYVSLALLKMNTVADGKFFSAYSKSSQFIYDVKKRSLTNATPQKINMDQICLIPIVFPSDENERKFIAEHLECQELELDMLEKRLTKTKAIKQGMMQELLTGRTRLK